MLIIVVGLVSILLTMTTAFMLRMRADAKEMQAVVDTASCRIMLQAGMCYLQESSLLGWLPNNAALGGSYPVPGSPLAMATLEAGNDAVPAFGWTDVRDGTLGPKGPRDMRLLSPTSLAPIPWPAWACTMSWRFASDTLGQKRRLMLSPVDSDLPAPKDRRWPCPGSVVRIAIARTVRPPFATRTTMAYNAVLPMDATGNEVSYDGNATFDTVWCTTNDANSYKFPGTWLNKIFDPTKGAVGALDPQPADPETGLPDDWDSFSKGRVGSGPAYPDWSNHRPAAFNNGKPTTWTNDRLEIVPGSENLVWFRIYREKLADHDGDTASASVYGLTDIDGNGVEGETISLTVNGRSESWEERLPYDRVALNESPSTIATRDPASMTNTRNWNTFIITGGCGPTRGYRFWSLPDDSPLRAVEPVTALESGLWCSPTASAGEQATAQRLFEQLLAQSATHWFRVEWTGSMGGAYNYGIYDLDNGSAMNLSRTVRQSDIYDAGAGSQSLLDNFPSFWRYSEIGSMPLYYDLAIRNASMHDFGGRFRFIQRLDQEPPLW